MKFKKIAFTALLVPALTVSVSAETITNPQSVKDLLNRIGGPGTSEKFVTVVDDGYKSPAGAEMFRISSQNGKPCITGTTLSAVTTGIGWYLNHTANVNVAWNNPYPTLGTLPAPAGVEEHTTTAEYRYYLNYCTFSYSMSTWTWERWQQEIDWMALHGINMPLQIIGLEEVWRQFLMEDYGYTLKEVSDFVGGPCFMAWFGMNNLEGHGGPNPEWWYKRQAQLGKQIIERMKGLGIEPVLPGFAGMVPSNFTNKTGIAAETQGYWCGFVRPYIVDSTKQKFTQVAANYYKRLKAVMGESRYYSIDPYHEGGKAPDDPGAGYKKMSAALQAAHPGAQWVIQSWQWSEAQRTCLDNIDKGKLIVLDLYSDGNPQWDRYKGHDTVYSTIFNFGGRTGFFGRFNGIIDGYFNARQTASVKGIGAAPEAIEQTPVMYDLLFELPWMSEKPDAATWMAGYAKRRYGTDSPEAASAWELLRTSALDCRTGLQGPHEAIICARPSLVVNKVSSWGGAEIFYDRAKVVNAAYGLLDANLSGLNYSYDLTDISRQALTDYSKSLLAGINEAHINGNAELFNKRRDAFLQLILDINTLLNSNSEFMAGHWTKRARAMADEVSGTTDADRDWLELDNARTLITTWGKEAQANGGGLRDYSYREWGGILKDYYYQRWKLWFDNGMREVSGGWFQWEWNWAHSNPDTYNDKPVGNTRTIAAELLPKYLSRFSSKLTGQAPIFIDRLLVNDHKKKFYDRAAPESNYTPTIDGDASIKTIAIDMNRNGLYEESETQSGEAYALSADAPVGERNARIELTDGTIVDYTVKILVDITSPRTVSVKSADPAQGSVSIVGAEGTSVTNTEVVTLLAKPVASYDFDYWTDGTGANVGNDNPLNYYGKENAEFTAHFMINKWGVPGYNGNADELATMKSYKQYINNLSVTQGGETATLYSAGSCPEEHFVQIPTRIKAAPGQEFTFRYTQPADGMQYLFLSAYCDFDQDGTFNTSDELLGTIGTRNAINPAVGAGEFTVLLPYDAFKGTTHIRLRFDGAWGPGYDDNIQAFPPDATTNRIIYELILEVTDAADFVSKVTVESSNTELGTVRSENEATNLYAPGDEVILTGFPKSDVRVARWVDNHGRELPAEWIASDGNSVNFKAFDNAHIICEFEPLPIEAGDFKLNWQPMTNGQARITGVAEGEGHILDLANTVVTVGAIAPGALDAIKNQVDRIILPDAHLSSSNPEVFFSAKLTGDGTQNKITPVTPTISGSDSWEMTIKGTNDGSSFNSWGSALYGNGTDALADDYSNGWSQYYLAKDGTLSIKWDCGNGGKVTFDDVKLLGDFVITSKFEADAKKLTVTASAGGKSQTKEMSNSSVMKDISQFATAIPKGINFTLSFARLSGGASIPGEIFANFRVLHDYEASESNAFYSVVDGIAYAKGNAGKVVGYPEGRLFMHPFTISESGKLLSASPVRNGDAITAESLGMTMNENPDNGLNALWVLEYAADDKVELHHVNSGLGANSSLAALQSTAGSAAKFNCSLVYGNSFPQLTLGSKTVTISEAKDEITIKAPAVDFGIALPVPVFAPAAVSCHTLTLVTADKGCMLEKVDAEIPAGQPIIVRGATAGKNITFKTACVMPVAAEGNNLLKATTVELTYPGEYYLLGADNMFRLNRSGNVPANSAYLLKSDLPSGMGESFALDDPAGIHEIGANAAKANVYDLQGRKVSKAGHGIFIINGEKKLTGK